MTELSKPVPPSSKLGFDPVENGDDDMVNNKDEWGRAGRVTG